MKLKTVTELRRSSARGAFREITCRYLHLHTSRGGFVNNYATQVPFISYIYHEFEYLNLNILPRSSPMDSRIGLARDVTYTDATCARDVTARVFASFTTKILFIIYKKRKKTLIINRPKNC